jgi:hypothetical protein
MSEPTGLKIAVISVVNCVRKVMTRNPAVQGSSDHRGVELRHDVTETTNRNYSIPKKLGNYRFKPTRADQVERSEHPLRFAIEVFKTHITNKSSVEEFYASYWISQSYLHLGETDTASEWFRYCYRVGTNIQKSLSVAADATGCRFVAAMMSSIEDVAHPGEHDRRAR